MPFFPVHGVPLGLFDPRNPTLIPDFDQPVENQPVLSTSGTALAGFVNLDGGVLVPLQSPAQFLTTFPRVNATDTLTVGGAPAAGNTVTFTLTNPILSFIQKATTTTFTPAGSGFANIVGGQVILASSAYTVSVTVGTAPTTTTVAEQIALAVENDPIISNVLTAVASGAVVTLQWPGPVGNSTLLSTAVTGATTLTAGATAFSGGTGPVIAFGNFVADVQNTSASAQALGNIVGNLSQAFFYGHAYNLSTEVVSALVTAGLPIA